MPSPKKNSPEKSPKKGSPDKTGKKGSPDKKGEDTQPVHSEAQTDPSLICLFCSRTFSSQSALQSHLLTIDHFIPGAPIQQRCKVCNLVLNIKDCEQHNCCKNKNIFLEQIVSSSSVKKGPPFICLLCRGRIFQSRIDLVIHLLCAHPISKIPGQCGECEFKYVETQPDTNSNGDNDFDVLPEYNAEFDNHIRKMHGFGYECVAHKSQLADTLMHKLYGCPLCGVICKTNSELHAHVIYLHATSKSYLQVLNSCVVCQRAQKSSNILNIHINTEHTQKFDDLANQLHKYGHYTKFIDFLHTCTICWATFDHDFDLQAHIVVQHAIDSPARIWKCGWCNKDFFLVGDLRIVWRTMERHEKIHARSLHIKALEAKATHIPLPESNPEETPISDAEENDEGVVDKGGKTDKQKSSPKNKKDAKPSPKKGKK